jgi:hypothetical protein
MTVGFNDDRPTAFYSAPIGHPGWIEARCSECACFVRVLTTEHARAFMTEHLAGEHDVQFDD